jgi:IclR family acetate operon transcriptional repressor
MSEETGGQSKTLVRGLSILNACSGSRSGLTLVEIADATDLAPSTVHRLLATLEAQSFLSVDNETGRWRIGVSGFRMGNGFVRSRDYVAQLRPLMIELSDQTGETVNLAILSGSKALFVSQIESANMMRMVAPLGSLFPLHASGAGKALLAALDQEERNELMDQLSFDAMTAKTLCSKASLNQEVEWIIAEGRSYDREEHVEGMQCVAAPVFNETGSPICALSVSGPSVRVTEAVLVGHGNAVLKTAHLATQLLGGIPPKHWASDV